MKKGLTYEVTENNGGGLTLYVWENKVLVYAHTGYEYDSEHTQLREDVLALEQGKPAIEDWDGNDLIEEDIVKGIREDSSTVYNTEGDVIPLTEDEYYDDNDSTKIICDSEGIYPSMMGGAGSKAFRIAE